MPVGISSGAKAHSKHVLYVGAKAPTPMENDVLQQSAIGFSFFFRISSGELRQAAASL